MITGAGIGTGLAFLVKENGALLPLYLWVMEITLLRELKPSRWIGSWRAALALPGVLLVLYWVVRWDALSESMQSRPFTLVERLLTEPKILADYVSLMFFPVRNALGPFHDDYPAVHGLFDPPATFIYVFGWLMLVAFAVIQRKRFPLLAFGVFWFLVGHSLESTVFNLELYFEHRNYLASLGPWAIICALLWRLPLEQRRLGLVVFFLYLGLQAFILRELAIVWGTPRVAAEMWLAKHPASERARQNLVDKYLRMGQETKALALIKEGFTQNPTIVGLGLQWLELACAKGEDISAGIAEVLPGLRHGDRSYSAIEALRQMKEELAEKACPSLSADILHQMLDELLDNAQYRTDPLARAELHRLKAAFYLQDRNLDPLMRHLEASFDARPNLDTGMLMLGALHSAGLFDVALEKFAYIRSRAPLNPLARRQWDKRLEEVEPDLKAALVKSKSVSLEKSK